MLNQLGSSDFSYHTCNATVQLKRQCFRQVASKTKSNYLLALTRYQLPYFLGIKFA